MNSIIELQNWFESQCNEDWEHTYGIEITTLDNPGWKLSIELTDSDLQYAEYNEFSYGVDDEAKISGDNWLITKVEEGKFIGFGGTHKLDEIINTFLAWAKLNT